VGQRLLWLAAACVLPAPAADPAGRLIQRIERGEVRLEYAGGGQGYLLDLLAKLDVPVDSQTLVHAPNSFQAARISPSNPRAIYFNDDVSVAFIPGADLIEISSLDPREGVVFYTLDAKNAARPDFQGCNTACHGIRETAILMVQSNARGSAFRNASTDHRTPFEQRWGGWYVSGAPSAMPHLGRAVAADSFDDRKYPLPTSDVVALMTLEHQTRMTNLMMAVNRNARAVAEGKMNAEWLDSAIEDLVAYMLFTEEAPLPAPVRGASSFAETFAQRGPRDAAGRSLRQFDLQTRLFRYPLSYMIYSEMFDGMDPAGRARVYRRLFDVLTGREAGGRYARLTAEDRRAVLEIVRGTKKNLPDYWRTVQ
jgi:hypothetical protein